MNKKNTQLKEEKALLHKKAIMLVDRVSRPLAEEASQLLEQRPASNFLLEAWFVKTKKIIQRAQNKEGLSEKSRQAVHEEIKSLEDFRQFLYVYIFVLEESIRNNKLWRIPGFSALVDRLMSLYVECWGIIQERLGILQEEGLLLTVPIRYFTERKDQGNALVLYLEELLSDAIQAYRLS